MATSVKNKKIPSLDGLRALSIFLVLFDHAAHSLSPDITHNWLYTILSNSDLGVRIFFVISGYLITRLLLEETERNGKINLKKFYIKRVLRIFPVFYLFILVIVLMNIIVGDVFYWTDILIAGTFLWNMKSLIQPGRNDYGDTGSWRNPGRDGWLLLGHFWTLAMEEQFYLIWPFVMKKVHSHKKLIRICIAIMLLMPLVRVAAYFLLPQARGQINAMIFTSCDTLLIGSAAALIEKTRFKEKFIRILSDPRVVALSIVAIFIISPFLQNRFGGTYKLTIGITITNVGILSLLLWSIYKENAWFRFLNLKPIMVIGVLSYSIYIWQQLFFFGEVEWLYLTFGDYKFYLNQFPQNIFLIALVSSASYYLYERRFLKLKDRLNKKSASKE